jgi:proline iminopeptidase
MKPRAGKGKPKGTAKTKARTARPGAAQRAAPPPARRTLYPRIEPYRKARLAVGDGHELYFEESGNPRGHPAVFLHGGPGGGTDPQMRRFFDPRRYRIVLFDQRGCGQSTPHASLEANTTVHLVADVERLREHLGIEHWLVFGGSWGSTLALAYAQAHPQRASGLVLRGIFLLRRWEISWFYQDPGGAAALFPDRWEEYLAPIPVSERGDMIRAYHRRLTGGDSNTRVTAARAWSIWEGALSFLRVNPEYIDKFDDPAYAAAFAGIECHYFMNNGFLRSDTQLLDDIGRMRQIPGVIVQGRYDVVCPLRSAWDLHRAWPEADLRIVPDAGHSAFEAGTVHELVSATDRFAR